MVYNNKNNYNKRTNYNNSFKKTSTSKTVRLKKDYGTKCITRKGEIVKSKAEMYLANFFFENNIPYKYEPKIRFENKSILYPDFTVTYGGIFYVVELFGLNNKKTYKKNKDFKTETYKKKTNFISINNNDMFTKGEFNPQKLKNKIDKEIEKNRNRNK